VRASLAARTASVRLSSPPLPGPLTTISIGASVPASNERASTCSPLPDGVPDSEEMPKSTPVCRFSTGVAARISTAAITPAASTGWRITASAQRAHTPWPSVSCGRESRGWTRAGSAPRLMRGPSSASTAGSRVSATMTVHTTTDTAPSANSNVSVVASTASRP